MATPSWVGGSGALSDSGTDNADGGDQYQLPAAEDSIDLQGTGGVENAAAVGTERVIFGDGTEQTTAGSGGGSAHDLLTNRGRRNPVHPNGGYGGQYVESENSTFLAYRGVNATHYAMEYDHDKDRVVDHAKLATDDLPGDDHGSPSILIDSNGTIHAFHSMHGFGNPHYASTASAYDVTSFSSTTISAPVGTYPYLAEDSNNNIYCLYRTGANGDHSDTYPSHAFGTILESTDGGSTWTDVGPVVDLSGHPDSAEDFYPMGFTADGTELHISFFVAHGGSHDDNHRDWVHCYYDTSDSTLYDLAGNSFGSTVTWSDITGTNALRAITREQVAAFDHAQDSNGTWHIGGWAENTSAGEMRLNHAEYDGGWTVNEVDTDRGVGSYKWHKAKTRVSDDGNIEILATRVGSGTVQTSITNDKECANLEKWTYDGSSWSHELIIDRNFRTTGTSSLFGISSVNKVKNGTDKLAFLFGEWVHGDADAETNHTRMWGIGQPSFSTGALNVAQPARVLHHRDHFRTNPMNLSFHDGGNWLPLLNWGVAGSGAPFDAETNHFGLSLFQPDNAVHMMLRDDWADSFRVSFGGSPFDALAVFDDGSISVTSQDLSTVSATNDRVYFSDGTNLTAGPAYYDGSTFTSLVDGTTYTP